MLQELRFGFEFHSFRGKLFELAFSSRLFAGPAHGFEHGDFSLPDSADRFGFRVT